MYSAPYLTLTAGDKGIKCPSESPKQCRKGPLGAPPFATMAILSASHATAHRWLHSLPPRAPGEAPRATRWWMRWSVGTEWPLAAASALPLLLSCRVRKLVAHRASRYLGWSSRQAPLAGALLPCRSAWRVAASSLECLGWPSRQAPLAGALSPELKYFVLEWLQGNHGGSWRSPGKPCRGVLQLPVHKFGVLGYPYSSTPTAAPGPGPHTVPSAVGPGPKQGTGTRGLGYAVSHSVSTAPSPNGTRRMRRRGRNRGWFFIRKGETSAPSLFISRGNRGSSFPLASCCYSFFTNSAAPLFFSKPREQRSAPHCHQHHQRRRPPPPPPPWLRKPTRGRS